MRALAQQLAALAAERDGLAEETRRLRTVVDMLPVGVWFTDAAGQILFGNPAAQRIWAGARYVPPAEFHQYKAWWEATGEPLAADEWALLRAIRGGETTLEERIVIECFDGTRKTILNSAFPVRGADGRVAGGVVVNEDVTARSRAERALRDESRRKDTFIATLGHELRNPLTPIRAGFELLRREGVDPAQRAAAAEVVDRQLRHLSRLVDDLLDVSRVSRGKVELRPRAIDLARLVRDAVADHRALFSRGGIAVEEQLPDAPLPAFGDAVRLAQALGNVLQNAAKFTPPGGRVRVTVEARDRRAEIRVADTGDGITGETLARLFHPFEQGERPGRAGGLGLGLALARGLVLAHGGELSARSDGPGRGSEFVFALPLSAAAEAADPPQPPQPARTGKHRVLLVEDNEDAGEMLRELLQLDGHEVALARDGAEGLACARTFRPDVVVSDLGLPGALDGYGLARALRAEAGAGLRIVALSGFAAPDDVARSHEAGFDAHFAKPLELERLRPLLEG